MVEENGENHALKKKIYIYIERERETVFLKPPPLKKKMKII